MITSSSSGIFPEGPFSQGKDYFTKILADAYRGKFLIDGRIMFEPKANVIISVASAHEFVITPLCARLLIIFCMHPGEILRREFLVDALWNSQGMVVSDNALNKAVSHLRVTMLQADKMRAYIKTINRIGYIFLGDASFTLSGR
ncbi:winged helix-turn-helix domain-containing protein [Burkholderia sp. S-53]|uniref:winged helix-turn-helix domain-containing protein n=1 Tax=Burkholderia sp. S-53 TaxID=2906514 RepID=UPI0021D033E5|nr:helix-turn-helix domain-containing protein [Burkholderia sp. S-53]UXU86120.1 helix-turn-helix domain-containing protein [Burkholderia sp. S-53]